MNDDYEKLIRIDRLSRLSIEDIIERLNKTKLETRIIQKEVLIERTFSNRQWGDRDSGGYGAWETVIEKIYEPETVQETVPDYETRLEAVRDLADTYKYSTELYITKVTLKEFIDKTDKLRKLLLQCYHGANSPSIRHIAGKALGYSLIRRLLDIRLRRNRPTV